MTLFETESGSWYQYNEQKNMIRRVSGRGEPTARLAGRETWKSCSGLILEKGSPAIILWGYSEDKGAMLTTVTSTVVGVY